VARFGYGDPIVELISFVASISSHIVAVIFHGVENCVPHYALKFAQQVMALQTPRFPTLLSDNLAPA
jgi:hypothetical protein